MVLGAYEKHVAGPRREAIKQAKQAQEQAEEQVKQAEEQAKLAEEQVNEMKAWNERRLQAEASGEPFNEPFPGDEEPELTRPHGRS